MAEERSDLARHMMDREWLRELLFNLVDSEIDQAGDLSRVEQTGLETLRRALGRDDLAVETERGRVATVMAGLATIAAERILEQNYRENLAGPYGP